MHERLIKTVNKTLTLIKKTEKLDVDGLLKPISGKEKSLFPLLISAGWQSGFVVCPEVKVTRRDKGNSGSVDAIFFDAVLEQDFIIEAKISTSRSEKNDVSRLKQKLKLAKSQLRDITGIPKIRKFGLVSCVIVKIVYEGKSEGEIQHKHDYLTKQRIAKIEEAFNDSDKFYCKSLILKSTHKNHNANSLNKEKKNSEGWCGAICVILEFVRDPSDN